MMVVNLANAIRLQDRKVEAEEILQKEDWSAVGDEFNLCVAAVREQEDEVVRLMLVLGSNGPVEAENYRTWPVFRKLRTKEKFAATFEKLFGSKLLTPKPTSVDVVKETPEVEPAILVGDGLEGKTIN